MPVKTPRLSRRRGQLGEEALDRVEPGGRGRAEMEMEALVPTEPGADFGMPVRGVMVDDQVHLALGRVSRLILLRKRMNS
jgi:hypothetical protein